MSYSPVKPPSISFHPKRKTGETTTIYARVYWSGKEFKIYTTVAINVNKYLGLVKSSKKAKWYDHPSVISDLKLYRTKLDGAYETYISRCKLDDVPFVFNQYKELCKSLFDDTKVNPLDIRRDLIAFATEFERTVQRSQGTKKTYRTVIAQLKDFRDETGQSTSFNSIDFDFYDSFVDFLYNIPTKTGEPVKKNTIGKKIAVLKVFLKQSFERGYHNNTIFTHSSFKTPRERIQAIALTEDHIESIRTVKIKSSTLNRARDVFYFNCLVGLRYSDLDNLKKTHLVEEDGIPIIVLKTQKTGTEVQVPVVNKAMNILMRYKFDLPKFKIQNFNRYIKEVGKLAGLEEEVSVSRGTQGNQITEETRPLYAWLTSHVMRKTFATNALNKGISIENISSILGHSSVKITEGYLGIKKRLVAKSVFEKLNS